MYFCFPFSSYIGWSVTDFLSYFLPSCALPPSRESRAIFSPFFMIRRLLPLFHSFFSHTILCLMGASLSTAPPDREQRLTTGALIIFYPFLPLHPRPNPKEPWFFSPCS